MSCSRFQVMTTRVGIAKSTIEPPWKPLPTNLPASGDAFIRVGVLYDDQDLSNNELGERQGLVTLRRGEGACILVAVAANSPRFRR